MYYLYSSDSNGLSVDWSYQSQSNEMQSLSWAYKLNEDFYSSGTSATEVSGTDGVTGSTWLNGLSTGVEHSLYVALLDQESGNVLDTDTHYFWYSAGSVQAVEADIRVMMEPIRVGTEDISPVGMGTKHRLAAITVLPNGNLPMPELREVMVQLNPG